MTSDHPPERMVDFFDARTEGYDEHMAHNVADFEAFYAAVAEPIPTTERPVRILDIGCGTGLELAEILRRAPHARITAVDLSAGMLDRLREKYAPYLEQIELIQDSYLTVPLPAATYDYAVAVMTLHHLLPEPKQALYERIRRALKPGGQYVEGDWVVAPEKEQALLEAHRAQVGERESAGEGAYHVDIPFSLATQRRLLRAAGFDKVEVVWQVEEAAVYVAHT